MPSLEIVEVLVDNDPVVAENPDVSATAPAVTTTTRSTAAANTAQKQPKPASSKVTPPEMSTAKDKKTAAKTKGVAKKKSGAAPAKGQLSIAAFFGGPKKPKQPQPASPTRNKDKTTTATNTTTESAAKTMSTPIIQPQQQSAALDASKKMALRDICVGIQLSTRPPMTDIMTATAATSESNPSATYKQLVPLTSHTTAASATMDSAASDSSMTRGPATAMTTSPKRLESVFALTSAQEEHEQVDNELSDDKSSAFGDAMEMDDEKPDQRHEFVDEDEEATITFSDHSTPGSRGSNQDSLATPESLADYSMNESVEMETSTMETGAAEDAAAESELPLESNSNETTTLSRPAILTDMKTEVNHHDEPEQEAAPMTNAVDATPADEQQIAATPAATSTRKRAASESSTSASAAKKRSSATQALETTKPTISEEHQKAMEKLQSMRERYGEKARQVLLKCHDLPEEQFQIAIPESAAVLDDAMFDSQAFPDFAVATLALLVEGSCRSLTDLASIATKTLNNVYATTVFTNESVADKLKLLATRKQYIKNPFIAATSDSGDSVKEQAGPVDLFEDEHADHMWRWEVTCVDLLTADALSNIKSARAARKKISSQFNALAKLIGSLNEADRLILVSLDGSDFKKSKNNKSGASQLEKVLARISQEEEKVLKFDRQEEALRLSIEAKRTSKAKKSAAPTKAISDESKKQKELEKETKAKEREAEKLKKAQEREAEKLKKAQEKELAKQTKLEEVERKKQEKAEKEAKEEAKKVMERKKQAACMMSIFQAKPAPATPVAAKDDCDAKQVVADQPTASPLAEVHPANEFWTAIGSDEVPGGPLFPTLSRRARASRKRRTMLVTTTVTVTVLVGDEAENPFDESEGPYAEDRQITVEVLNKKKFLSFYEDIRPPYYGTWSKKCANISGNKPGEREDELDYDHDSEAEWEEGDDEVGEDVEVETPDDDDDKELDDYETNDGWFANDDEVIYEGVDPDLDGDDQSKNPKWQDQLDGPEERGELVVCTVAPVDGRPYSEATGDDRERQGLIDGFDFQDAHKLLKSHTVHVTDDSPIYLDAFPPDMIEESDPSAQDGSSNKTLTDDDMRALARFVHTSTLSKAQLVDDFRSKHKGIRCSRSQVTRLVESFAEKQKIGMVGQIVWMVKTDILENLGLDDLVEAGSAEPREAQREAARTIARFVHHSTISSKEKLIDDFRMRNATFILSRQQILKVLDEVAEKKKHPGDGFYWEIKADARVNFDLDDLAASPPEKKTGDEPAPSTISTGARPRADSDSSSSILSSTSLKRKAVDEVGALQGDNVEGSPPKKHKPTQSSVNMLQSFLIKKKTTKL